MSGDYFPGSERWKEQRALEYVGLRASLLAAGNQADPASYLVTGKLYDQMGSAERRMAVGNSQANPALLRRLSGGNPIRYNHDNTGMGGYSFPRFAGSEKALAGRLESAKPLRPRMPIEGVYDHVN